MRRLSTIIVLASFIGIASFGVFRMHEGMQHHNGGCVAATAQGVDCPKGTPLQYLVFHFNAFKNFSTATLALALLIVGSGLILFLGTLARPQLKLLYFRSKRREFFDSSPERRLLRWLALHENSPSDF